MSLLVLNINNENNTFILEGAIELIFKNRNAKFYFEDSLNGKFQDNTCEIPFKEIIFKESILKKIREALRKYQIEFLDSDNISKELSNYFDEEQKFLNFSKKAKSIWNNEIDANELIAFKNVLIEKFPIRRLYDKQLLASFHLAFSQNACNFSVPGAGKTSIVYGAYAYLNSLPVDHPKYINKLLIIGPLSSFGPWEEEYFECFGVKVNSKRLSGGVNKEIRDSHLLSIKDVNDTPELTLLSYQSVASNLDNIKSYLKKRGNNVMIVLDEAHKIKNVDGGLWSSAVLSLAKLSKARVVLTGTPLPNGFEDIFNLFKFIWPDKNIIQYHLFQLKDMSKNRFDSRISKLVENVSPFFIRIRKTDLGLPKPIENNPILIPMGKEQREIYDFIENHYVDYFQNNNFENNISAQLTKARFIRLLQAATNPGLLKLPIEKYYSEYGVSDELFIDDKNIFDKILKYSILEIPSKFLAASKLISEIILKNQKVVVWTVFIQNAKELQSYLLNIGIASKLLIGETPVDSENHDISIDTRESIIRQFHLVDSKFKVIIANPFAVAESISLHKACHNAIYLERNFNAANYLQSKDRIHRYGLKPEDIINYYYILSEASIDETVHSRLIEKERRMLEIIESETIPLINMNSDYEDDFESDIKSIIRDYVGRVNKV